MINLIRFISRTAVLFFIVMLSVSPAGSSSSIPIESPSITQPKTVFSLHDWQSKDNNFKIALMRRYIQVAREDKVFLRLPAEYYVKEIDLLIVNSIKNGESSALNNALSITIKTIAIMEGDWDNGENKLELAKKHMGPKIFEDFKSRYPDKYNKLLIENGAGEQK